MKQLQGKVATADELAKNTNEGFVTKLLIRRKIKRKMDRLATGAGLMEAFHWFRAPSNPG